jgi:predicted acyltransferase
MSSADIENKNSNRLLSLDFMRGFIMVLLALESTQLYEHLLHSSEHTIFHNVFLQFFHHPWNGFRFWDLIQPGFMFIAGTAMAYSLDKQQRLGVSWNESFIKILKRSFWLFFWGVLIYAVEPDGTLSFELWNVLTQLSFTTLIAFFVFRWDFQSQIIVCIVLLIITEGLYRLVNVPGYDQPFTNLHNIGNYIDLVLMNKINPDGWVAINVIPTAVHTIAGSMVGKLLLSNSSHKIRSLILGGIITLLAGYLLDFMHVTPVIKRIATTSFVLVSTGWCLLTIAFIYWWIDIKKHQKYLSFFIIVGMNSLLIYLFFEIIGWRWFNGYIAIITSNLFQYIHLSEMTSQILTSIIIFFLEWYMCYFLYRKKIFFRL